MGIKANGEVMEPVKHILWICFFTLLALIAKASIFEWIIFMLVFTLSDDISKLREEIAARLPTDKGGV